MKTISLKIEDSIFGDTEKILNQINKPRNRYINEALMHYNQVQRRHILKERMKLESELVKNESIVILKEFDYLDYDN